jgi:hypothetical protein
VIPLYICPKKHWYSRRVVVIGDAIDPQNYIKNKFPSTKDIEQISNVLMEGMNRCMIQQ